MSTNRGSKHGGRREPPGGRPPKGNIKFYCYLQPGIVETIDQARGELTRGEFITLALAALIAAQRGGIGIPETEIKRLQSQLAAAEEREARLRGAIEEQYRHAQKDNTTRDEQ